MHIPLKRKTQILVFLLATFCMVAISIFAIKPTDEPKAHILVKAGRESRYVPAIDCSIPVINSNREEQINSQIVILKGRFLIQNVVTSLGPATIHSDLDVKKIDFRLPSFLAVPGRIRCPPRKRYL